MRLSILIYDGLTTLDAIGGYEILARLPGMETEFVAAQRGIVAADTRRLGLAAFRDFSEVTSTDILYVPGGPGGLALEKDEALSRYDPPARQDLDLDCRHLQRRRSARRRRIAERTQGNHQLVLPGPAARLGYRVRRRALSPRRQIHHRRRRFREHRYRPVPDVVDRGRTGGEDATARHRILSGAAISGAAVRRTSRSRFRSASEASNPKAARGSWRWSRPSRACSNSRARQLKRRSNAEAGSGVGSGAGLYPSPRCD